MALGETVWTYVDGQWCEGDRYILRAADHATWLGTLVFDGARRFEGVAPDLDRHMARVADSCVAMGLRAPVSVPEMLAVCEEGLARIPREQAVYIRPMIWSVGAASNAVAADPEATAFSMCLETVPMPDPAASTTLGKTSFTRPTLAQATVNAKAACLYPNNGRMLNEVNARGFGNALVCDPLGNVAETATSNIFMVRDGEFFTPIPNGTFLNGITRQRFIALLRADGFSVHESTLGYRDFESADEVFATGNLSKITPVTAFEDTRYEVGPMARRCRELYWDWALSS